MKESEKLEQIKVKLKKLMRKEESARELGNLAEAEAFASKIQQMLINYELELQDLMDGDDPTIINPISEELVDCGTLTNRHESSWVVYLYDAAATGNFCKILIVGRGIAQLRIKLMGDENSREFVHYMVHQLVPKLRSLARRSFKEYQGPDKRNTYIRSFLRGAAVGIRQRLIEELRKQSAAEEKVDAIVINKGAQLQNYVAEKYPKTGTAKSRKSSSAEGYHNGAKAGKSVGINKGIKTSQGVKKQRLLS